MVRNNLRRKQRVGNSRPWKCLRLLKIADMDRQTRADIAAKTPFSKIEMIVPLSTATALQWSKILVKIQRIFFVTKKSSLSVCAFSHKWQRLSFFFIPLAVTFVVTRLLPHPWEIDIKAVPRRLHPNAGEPFQIWFPNLLTMLPRNQIELYVPTPRQFSLLLESSLLRKQPLQAFSTKDWLVPIVQPQ